MTETKKKKLTWSSPLVLLGGILIGVAIGLINPKFAAAISPLGDIFLNLMFTIVVPMVFVSIATAVGNMVNMQRLGKILGSMVAVFIITGLFAAILVITTVTIFPPSAGNVVMEATEMAEPSSVAEMIVSSLTVNDFAGLMSRRNMLPLIFFAILFGLGMSMAGGGETPAGKFFNNLNDIIMKMVEFIMLYAPIGLGAYFASLIADLGPQLLGEYFRVMVIYYPLCLLYGFVFFPLYSYYAAGKVGVQRMAREIFKPALTAFATQSSVATLPVNLEASANIGVPKDIREIVLPMGATMHMDGSVISSIVKISFLFGVFGMPYAGIGTYALSIAVSILSAFVLSGVPGGGLVGEMLIVSIFGFPPEAFPLIATIGFLVDPMATALNSSGDTIAAMMVTKLVEGNDWLSKRLESGEVV